MCIFANLFLKRLRQMALWNKQMFLINSTFINLSFFIWLVFFLQARNGANGPLKDHAVQPVATEQFFVTGNVIDLREMHAWGHLKTIFRATKVLVQVSWHHTMITVVLFTSYHAMGLDTSVLHLLRWVFEYSYQCAGRCKVRNNKGNQFFDLKI